MNAWPKKPTRKTVLNQQNLHRERYWRLILLFSWLKKNLLCGFQWSSEMKTERLFGIWFLFCWSNSCFFSNLPAWFSCWKISHFSVHVVTVLGIKGTNWRCKKQQTNKQATHMWATFTKLHWFQDMSYNCFTFDTDSFAPNMLSFLKTTPQRLIDKNKPSVQLMFTKKVEKVLCICLPFLLAALETFPFLLHVSMWIKKLCPFSAQSKVLFRTFYPFVPKLFQTNLVWGQGTYRGLFFSPSFFGCAGEKLWGAYLTALSMKSFLLIGSMFNSSGEDLFLLRYLWKLRMYYRSRPRWFEPCYPYGCDFPSDLLLPPSNLLYTPPHMLPLPSDLLPPPLHGGSEVLDLFGQISGFVVQQARHRMKEQFNKEKGHHVFLQVDMVQLLKKLLW